MSMIDPDEIYTRCKNGVIVYLDDWVNIERDGETVTGEVVQISTNGHHLKLQLETGEIVDVSASAVCADHLV